MSELKPDQLRKMNKDERDERMKELKENLLRQRASVAMGGSPLNPGLIKSIRRQIARIRTVDHEEETKR
ncbi:50S ribosomal protein L29 [Cuniculiplasma divulgatum]|jgi:large subunit ribosomal protein L29|uniref:Large ribosomal subunit protein uL29 n=1 Tax=Cuniculiplasma divulgatum TaxID=1673428 RepID=A0A1N5VY63_9ARCH|nr:50S ribosomal protein L29 [Cuniculiplasma divulgatum]EQB68282.1 MAG: 50S ribosomal protein L29P [Thermoplasmatales archaeon Gpl]MCI2412172.1 50S ribosomal protein L29 [Cuniculiplasma sp.]MCL4319921.1 50S ribosomal protein L29 [Candidatus Thermoplasmatota archaeon]WMT49698.1 MAG: 50S ribosomal protein L29 [Thermoplasmatales archaeon]MCL6014947.1 50S ribosomal protein L29 [Candidatus Thermoplasmatota archaeon]